MTTTTNTAVRSRSCSESVRAQSNSSIIWISIVHLPSIFPDIFFCFFRQYNSLRCSGSIFCSVVLAYCSVVLLLQHTEFDTSSTTNSCATQLVWFVAVCLPLLLLLLLLSRHHTTSFSRCHPSFRFYASLVRTMSMLQEEAKKTWQPAL